MESLHFISVSGKSELELAYAIREKGYQVSVSCAVLDKETEEGLRANGCICHGEGWFPEKLTKDMNLIVLGNDLCPDNPELLRAKKLGVLIRSISEFIYHWTKFQTRLVISGTHGRKAIISLIVRALKQQRLDFDYVLSGRISELPTGVRLSDEARIVLIEAHPEVLLSPASPFRLAFYRPHIAILTTILWTPGLKYETPEEYLDVFRSFLSSIEREGKLIYYRHDKVVSRLVEDLREDITAMAYEEQTITRRENTIFLKTNANEYPIQIPDSYFLTNLQAAHLASRQLGVKDANFYQAIADNSLSLPL
ncbi:MAG: UDP-N-acetylmuramate--alanine ligase [Tannerellaceae bacterium]|jgi:UDP-N-acetylmuramate: L-alanyl-gamma-D-glutamyl-meso-diaminopimelate ligase|nr:UDP-N-acetylmuramate--alanine ligase [Tannerellaceae bacterium]